MPDKKPATFASKETMIEPNEMATGAYLCFFLKNQFLELARVSPFAVLLFHAAIC
jgi:hypothetical protein